MKKLLLLLLVLTTSGASAQFYAGISAGYAIGANKRVNGTEYTSNSKKTIYGSYGEGFNGTLKLGYMFSEHYGVELGTSYLIGASQTIEQSSTVFEDAKSSGLRLAPQFVMKMDNGIYSRLGMIVPVMGSTIIDSEDSDFMGTGAKKVSEVKTSGSFSIGFIAAAGYSFALSENLDFFAELEYVGMSIKSGGATVTKFDVNGNDILPKLPTSAKEIEFVDEVIYDKNPDPTQPSQVLKQKAPFSSLGLNVGVVFKF